MALHETFTNNPDLAFLLGPARPDFNLGNTWFGSVSIWSGPIIGFSGAGNPVIEVQVSGIPGVTAIQAEIFGTQTYDGAGALGLASVNVTMIEWSLPGSATILARYTFASPVVFPTSVSRFAGDLRFVDILDEVIAAGGSPQDLFDDFFQNADTLVGGAASDRMYGGGGGDILDGGAGADQLAGQAGADTFIYRSGDAVAGENIDGGTEIDAVLAIGSAVTGDLFQAGGVNISSVNINSVEEVNVNGTEVVINSAQLAPGGFQTIVGRTGFADQLTIGNVASGNLSSLNLVNWNAAQDVIAVVGTAGADSVTGSIGNDIFLGLGGADTFDGDAGADRFLIMPDDFNPADTFNGGTEDDVLQVDSTAINSVSITPITNLRNLTLDSIETLDIVKGSFVMDASDFVGAIGGSVSAPVTSTVGIDHIIGNGGGAPNNILLEIQLGNLLGIDMRSWTFDSWNDGFYVDKTLRIIAGAQTQVIYCPNEESWVVGTASTTGVYVIAGNQSDQVYGSNQRDYVQAGDGDDYVLGLGNNDILDLGIGSDDAWGGEGDDAIGGGEGADHLYGENGADRLIGNAGTDLLDGGLGGDHLWGGLGADQHIGGNDAGIDFARYDDANHGDLTIRLDGGANVGAVAVGDTYNGIEGLVGGLGADRVYGNGQVNYLYGGGAADFLYGLGDADYLSGDAGGDHLWGGLGADQHVGGDGAGIDYARYDDANYGNLTISLLSPATNTGAAAGDLYTGIEGLVGGVGADVVVGNSSANYLFGGGAADFIDALGGADYMNGGAGADRFRFSTALGAGNVDTIADFVHLTDDMLLSKSLFAAVGATLTADELRIGMAQDANDFILYNNGTGALYYDSNANAAGGIVQFATVTAGTILTFDDFVMV